MTAFILSAAIGFALYELLAFMHWPPTATRLWFYRGAIVLAPDAARTARGIIRALIVIALLLFVLTVHNVAPSIDALATYEVNIVIGFAFGPLLAMWVNSVVVHSTTGDLSRSQLVAAIGLVLLFFLGAVGNETSKLIRQYAQKISTVKVAGAELSFTVKERGDRLTSTAIAGTSSTYVAGGSQGLQTLALLANIIRRDREYLTRVLAPPKSNVSLGDLEAEADFADASIVPPAKCLLAWFQRTADSHPVERYLSSYATAFRELEALNTDANVAGAPLPADILMRRVRDISLAFVRNGLTMAVDIARSTPSAGTPSAADKEVRNTCQPWFDVYCPPDKKTADTPAATPECLETALQQISTRRDGPWPKPAEERIVALEKNLSKSVAPAAAQDPHGLEALPYFAIARASIMTQIGEHEAAAAILDDWLRKRRDFNAAGERKKQLDADEVLRARESWLALRVRTQLVAFVEEWLEDDAASTATVVQSEHLDNLRAASDGLRGRLLRADFFRGLDTSCTGRCEPVFKRPAECTSDEPAERLSLWRKLYSSYVTMEATYVQRALEHPDYQARFAETVNEQARRLVHLDLSCGIDEPRPEVVYGQSLLAFAQNGVSYSRLRAATDGDAAREARLDDAEHAVKFALELVDRNAADDQERAHMRYLDRVAPSFAVQVQEKLKAELKVIDKTRRDLRDRD